MDGPVIIRLKRVGANADIPLPRKMTVHSAGFDVCAAVPAPVALQPGERRLIPCGFAMALPEGFEAQMRPRSGLASKHGISMINTPGTIDSDYRGEVHVPLINLGQAPFTVERGMRIGQMIIQRLPDVRIEEVDELDDTARGAGGFGHTGH